MHSGLFGIRNEMPMNCRARRQIELTNTAKKEVASLEALWTKLRTENAHNGDYLFGEFSLADAFFAPVMFRFQTYGIALSAAASDYQTTMLAHPAMQEWLVDAVAETDVYPGGEIGEAI
jgi:glutathione S-transferase